MQNGSITRSKRLKGPDVWEFRWREFGPDGKRKHRRMVVGSSRQFADESAALRTISALRRDINLSNARLRAKPITVSELVDHYRQRELEPDTAWKTHSTKVTYQGYLNKWILPRWGAYPLSRIQAGEVERWLRSLPLARSTCAKARNLLSILFNWDLNPCYRRESRMPNWKCKKPQEPERTGWRSKSSTTQINVSPMGPRRITVPDNFL